MQVVWDREQLDEARLAQLEPSERARVASIQRAREFGESLGLASSTSFQHLLDRDDDGIVRVVVAAPADRLEPVTWWFPIVGRISYRGYFNPARADDFAAGLADQGYDTYVRAAPLYSTLGWFDDPIPRAMLAWSEIDVVDTALHELVHETVFVSGDPNYNEAIATFIGQEATLRFFADEPEVRALALRIFADQRRFAELLDELSAELGPIYAGVGSPDEARRAREPVFARFQGDRFRDRGWQTKRYDGFLEIPLSNAYLVAHQTYLGELRCFAAWLARLDADLVGFIAAQKEDPGARPPDLPECAS